MNIWMLVAEVQAIFTCQRVNGNTMTNHTRGSPAAYNPKINHGAFYGAFLRNIPVIVSPEVIIVTIAGVVGVRSSKSNRLFPVFTAGM